VLERAGHKLFLKVYGEKQTLGRVEGFITDHNDSIADFLRFVY
jgi:hypothetical protein